MSFREGALGVTTHVDTKFGSGIQVCLRLRLFFFINSPSAVSSLSLPPMKDSCQKPACYEKTVTLSKEPYDSLGMTVAGGMSSRGWDLPVYVTNVDPDGVVGKEGSIRKGNGLPFGCLLLPTGSHDLTIARLLLPPCVLYEEYRALVA